MLMLEGIAVALTVKCATGVNLRLSFVWMNVSKVIVSKNILHGCFSLCVLFWHKLSQIQNLIGCKSVVNSHRLHHIFYHIMYNTYLDCFGFLALRPRKIMQFVQIVAIQIIREYIYSFPGTCLIVVLTSWGCLLYTSRCV